MVLGYHAIWGAYGFWLPNEERGSWSTEVWAPNLQRFGPATKTEERRSLAGRPYNHDRRREMRAALKYPTVRFDPKQVDSVARGFASVVKQLHINLLACAIMPDHVHVVTQRHRATIEYVVGILKRAATRQLT